jgi:uncharacterized protein YjiS (DUF1127 family)
MSILTHNSMTNHHAGLLAQIGDTLQLWQQRYRARRELAQWSSRDLQDVGLSWSDIALEADKPFWRA